MKTIKNTVLAIAAVAMVMPVFNGCKKGEGDPAISLKSRKSRVAGEWTVSNMSSKWSNTSGNPAVTSSGTETFDGTNVVTTNTSGGTTVTSPVAPDTHTRTWTVTFEKDGTYKTSIVDVETSSFTSGGTTYTATSTTTEEESGTWTFEGGTGDSKKKEYIAMYETSSTSTTVTTSGGTSSTSSSTSTAAPKGGSPMVLQLTTLKGKEMIAHMEDTNTWSNTSGGSTSSSSGSSSMDITFTAK